MWKVARLFFSNKFFIFILFSFSFISIKSDTIYEINQDIPGNSEYKKFSFESEATTFNHFFKYSVKNIPKSRIGALRFFFDSFNELSKTNNVFCTFVDDATTDAALEEKLRELTSEDTSCVGQFNSEGIYDGIIEYDTTKTKLGIYLVSKGAIPFTATVYVRTVEKFLDVKEGDFKIDEQYSIIPFTVVISDFRNYASKILFYSYTRELQMYYAEESTPYPGKLFSGNVMSVYTNPNMVHQKYHDANYMVLLTRDFSQEDKVSELFKFQVKFFDSNYLLDYYVSNNPDGRSKNSPLSINMTECENPYYVILNYNKPEKQISLYIDQIYGKIKSLSVAPTFSCINWDDMIETDMQPIQVSTRKFVLPKESETHMDVYKVECDIPLLLNFYYVDETANIPELNFGQVAITTLKSYKTVSFPFASGINLPELTIEIFNPIKLPSVIVNDGQNENMYTKNTLIRSMPFTTSNPIVIKERGGDSDTRVIIKVGYNTQNWDDHATDVKYNPQLNMYVFSFPNNEKRFNYTFAYLVTNGTIEGDNVKYCYGTNIGSAIIPSNENCYRVSKNNSYTLKILNPLVMHKDYDIDDDLSYYVSLKPVVSTEKMKITPELHTYDTLERNIEGIGQTIKISSTGDYKSILTSPELRDVSIFLQVQQCDNTPITIKVLNAYEPSKTVLEPITIPSGTKNFYKTFNNILLETELSILGNSGTNVFVKHAGVRNAYYPSIKGTQEITFNSELNQLTVENPINNYERMKYIVLVSGSGGLSNKGITLCSFTTGEELSTYNKTVESYTEKTSIILNFNKAGLKAGDKFEVLVFTEQQLNSKMAFLSDIVTGTVGEISIKTFTEVKTPYDFDNDYLYARGTASASELTYYFSYLPETTFDVPVGALTLELDNDAKNGFSNVDCAFVDENEDAFSMVEAIEDVIDSRNPYCIGGKSNTNGKIYNFIFKYSYTTDKKPRKLVIKISNGQFAVGGFTVFVRKGENTYIENTGFDVQEEYGKSEEYKKTVMPYIFDLERIRGKSDTDYVSKVLVFSQHLEMQMYYLDETEQTNAPILLFTGNIMLVYTKLDLAIQKYHTVKLILLSENLSGQEHSSLGNQYRFHTKMFKSDAQIEYFLSNNPTGRTLNYPLSVEMNTCTSTNNKYYYILNYNKAEEERILYLDMIFGSIKRVRIANEINAEKWDDLIQGSMTDIYDYQITCPKKSQHIDVVEIECNTPLLANFYYNYEGQIFSGLELGDIAVKTLGAGLSTTITLDTSVRGNLYYSISLFNPVENPNIVFKFGNYNIHEITENALQIGVLLTIPESISINNNGNTPTRFIFKIGYGVESQWIDEKENIEGKLYSQDNKYVYKFPLGDNKRNFTNVTLNVKPMKKGSEEESPNVKFCYSTSMGMPIDVSLENCYRTGANIPYSLTFINPLISPKNYKTYSDYYYVTLSPFYPSEYISLEITENKYDTKERNIEGVGNIVKLEEDREKSTILSIPEIIANTNILLQMQLCDSTENSINYKILNAYTHEEIDSFTLSKNDRFYTKPINNNLMETELKFIGQINDTIFVKHIGLTNYEIHLQDYKAVFEEDQNIVIIDKPILNEAFRVTVLVGQKGTLNNYTLCTFAEKSESQYKTLADYVNTFTSVTSNVITHYIDFRSFFYDVGTEFDLLVYAVQVNNAKIEILYNVISGKVGKIQDVVKISDFIEGKPDYVSQKFIKNTTSNYLYFDFGKNPTGFVASLKIKAESEVEEGMRVNKVGCIFVSPSSDDLEMVKEVNNAMIQGTSVCIGESQKDSNGYDALISAMDLQSGSGNKRLVIQIIYGLGEEKKIKNELKDESITMNITLRINGVSVKDQDYGYNENEQLTLVPYILDLLDIRGDNPDNYVSKVLLFSNTREMQMFYLDSGAPKELFSGNIMLVYTNPDVINEKYFGAKTMILVTDSLSATQRQFIGEQFRFKASFFDSKTTIQYYVSANPIGRLLNNPTSIEMLSCDQPYYYILNYHSFEEDDRVLHIDNIFGVVDTMKIATQLNDNNWFDFVSNMEPFSDNEYLIKGQTKYHMDVLEVTCKIPLLLNVYYTDPYVTKKTNLDQGDISIITLAPGTSETLTFKLGLEGQFIFSFNVQRSNNLVPNIVVVFEEGVDEMPITQNGIITRKTDEIYPLITIKNNQITGSDQTKVIFKLGYDIQNTFTKIKNDVYNLQTNDRPANLFAYIFRNGDDRLNYTKYDFEVTTDFENVKFCYSSNLGAFIDPSLQNCFRVGRTNSYTISLLNPYVMYKNYNTEKEYMDYYVSFRTEDINLNITIIPNPTPYSTNLRNKEGYATSIPVNKEGTSTILTNPSNNKKYLFVQMHVCTKDKSVGYEFKNAYNNTSLGETGTIVANTVNNFRNIESTNLDTLLTFEDLSNADETTKVFVKHVGMNEKYQPIVNELTITFDKKNKEINFVQPISGEAFDYTIYISKKNNLVKQAFTLCSFVEMSKLAPFSKKISSSDEKVSIKLDFNSKDLKELKQFDALVLAQQLNNGQLMILSNVISGNAEDTKGGSNKVLVIILVVLAVILVCGGVFLCIYLRRLKEKPMQKVIKAQATDLEDIQNANKGEKMLDSMAQSQANENQS